MKAMVDASDAPSSKEFRNAFYEKTKKLAMKYCVGENEHKCLMCGREQNHATGMCQTCRKALSDRGVIRTTGKTRKEGAGLLDVDDEGCVICGRPAKWLTTHSNLCKTCYYTSVVIQAKSVKHCVKATP